MHLPGSYNGANKPKSSLDRREAIVKHRVGIRAVLHLRFVAPPDTVGTPLALRRLRFYRLSLFLNKLRYTSQEPHGVWLVRVIAGATVVCCSLKQLFIGPRVRQCARQPASLYIDAAHTDGLALNL